ncbi:MAG TPA: ATP-binding protein [Bryobacteraceae bacterium]|nr:ATP-binding protein [Bryobacteraceae bacterium]
MGSERILIHAPFGRDGALLSEILRREQFVVELCPCFENLCNSIPEGAGAILIGDEALGLSRVLRLSEELANQPAWSDLNLLVMTNGGRADVGSQHRLHTLEPLRGPMTLLERPLRIATLLSAVHSALRSRRRQYQLRDLLQRETENAASLRAANEALRQSNASLAEFAYVASHDLQEPLRSVTAYTQLLSRRYKGQLDQTADEYIQFATDGALRMMALIEDLLQYAQVTSRASPSELKADTNAALAVAQENLGALIKETAANIESDSLPSIAVDFTQLVQLFQNLIGNAIKYRSEGTPPHIRIAAVRQGPDWRFSVSDNGIGFAQEYAEHVFGVFKRLNRNAVPGTGIGLALCKRIVENHGGRIWAESQPGMGSTFYFLLPGRVQGRA